MKKVRSSPFLRPCATSSRKKTDARHPIWTQDMLIVNTSRGPVVNESDLVDALESGHGRCWLSSFPPSPLSLHIYSHFSISTDSTYQFSRYFFPVLRAALDVFGPSFSTCVLLPESTVCYLFFR
jgi:hypothetical protein